MSNINDTIASPELAQIGWVVPDIHAAIKFLSCSLGVVTEIMGITPEG